MAQNLSIIRLSTEFTRPANTTAYTANSAVSDGSTVALTCLNPDGTSVPALKVGASYQIKTVGITMDSSGTTNASFDVYLYSSGVTAFADNADFTLAYNLKHIRIGKTAVTLATGDTNSTCAEAVSTDVNQVFKAQTSTLGFHLVASAGYTPISSGKIYIKVMLIEING